MNVDKQIFSLAPGGGSSLIFVRGCANTASEPIPFLLRNREKDTLSLAVSLGKAHCFSYKFCQKVPFPKQNCRKMARSAKNFRELSSSNTFAAPEHTLSLAFLCKKHTLSLAFFVKITVIIRCTLEYL